MLVLSWMVCNVRLSTNNGCSSGKEGGSVSKRYHEIPVLAIQRLDWRFIITSLGRVVGAGKLLGMYITKSSVRVTRTLIVSTSVSDGVGNWITTSGLGFCSFRSFGWLW